MIAMNLYCKLPFGRLHERNPDIIQLARLMDRSAGSLAMKLCNLASLDPAHQSRGVRGLSGVSRLDRDVWAEFHREWERLSFESETLLARLENRSLDESLEAVEVPGLREGLERERLVKQRVYQRFFRQAVLAAYSNACCITGLNVPGLLVASHVIPWAENKEQRVNPRNGLCLNALHDRAFDQGLITLTTDYRVEVSRELATAKPSEALGWLLKFDQSPIRLPERFVPDAAFIQWHRNAHGFSG